MAEQRGARTDARVSSKGLDTPASGQRSLSKSKRLSRSPTSAELARLNEDEDGDEDEMDDEGGSSSDAGAAAEVTPARSLKGAAKPTPASSSRKRKQQDDEDEDEEDEDEDEPSTPTSSKKKNIPGRRPTPDGVRRSKRHRVEPLKYWRNERIYYDLGMKEGEWERDAAGMLRAHPRRLLAPPRHPRGRGNADRLHCARGVQATANRQD